MNAVRNPPPADAVTVVTVTYADRWEAGLETTISSVLADPRTSVIVVSNGAAPASLERLRALREREHPRVELIEFDRNRGSAPAFSAGLAAAYRRGAAVLLLDDDNPISPSAIDRLQAVSATLSDLGAEPAALACFRAVNPVHTMLREGESAVSVFAELRPGAFLTTDVFRRRRTTGDERKELRTTGGVERVVALGNTMWGGTYLPPSVARLGILPPPELVLYGDDNAFSARLRRSGAAIYLCLDIEIDDTVDWHQSAAPVRGILRIPRVLRTPSDQLWRVRYQHRNAAYLSREQARGSAVAIVRLALNAVVRLGMLFVAAVVARRLPVYGAIVGACIDGLRGRLGESYPLPGGRAS